MTLSYDFVLEFNHEEYSRNFTHRTFLAAIDQYLETLSELIQSLVRHYDYLLVPEKKLTNITETTFEYRIQFRLLAPAQLPLDHLLTPEAVLEWTVLLTEYFITSDHSSQVVPAEDFAIKAGFRDSFLYSPISETLITKKSLRYEETRLALPSRPVIKKKNEGKC